MGVPLDPQSTTQQTQQKPSFFKSILGGALLGLASGLQEHSQQQSGEPTSFGDDLASGVGNALGGMNRLNQQRFTNDLAMRASNRADQQVANDTQRTQNETQEAMSRADLNHAQAAHLLVDKLRLERLIEAMPQEQAQERYKTWASATSILAQAGLQQVTTLDESPATRTAFLQHIQQEGGKVTDYSFGPAMEPGKIVAYRTDPTRVIGEDIAKKLSRTVGIEVPAGIPVQTADALITAKLHGDASKEVARIEAGRRAAAEKPLQLKDALQLARQELSGLIEQDALVPQSKKRFKTPQDISSAVNKRAQELLDLDGQLRRSGISQPQATIGLFSQLTTLRKRGANDAELKQQIAAAAANGSLTPQEILALYDKLGLTPGVTNPTPQIPTPTPGASDPSAPAYKPQYRGFGSTENQ